jgi:ankyrin repeat protein
MEYLIGLKGDVNAVDADGDTPLHDAAKFGHDAVVDALLKAGADKAIRNKEGKSATDLAAANGKDAVVKMLA